MTTPSIPSWTERDFRDYGPNPPDPQWPGGGSVAVSVVINAEVGAELTLAQGDERNEAVYEIIEPVDGVPNPCLSSHFDYGPHAGYWRIVRLLERFLEHATATGDAWFAKRLEIAEHWRERMKEA